MEFRSEFARKVLHGESTTAQDWTDHLRIVHRESGAMTPRMFALMETRDGRSSYQALAACLKGVSDERRDLQVLDLACGDGFLAKFCLRYLGPEAHYQGIDFCEAEIEAARRDNLDPRVSFSVGFAQELKLSDQSQDAVLSHMALMLLEPLAPALTEIARVLKPGGIFGAVVDGPASDSQSLLPRIFAELHAFTLERFPKFVRGSRMGDPRFRTREGVHAILSEAKEFTDVRSNELKIRQQIATGELAGLINDFCYVGILPDVVQKEWQDLVTQKFDTNPAGSEIETPLLLVEAKRV